MTLYYKDKNLSNNVTLAGSPTVNSFVIGNFSKNNYASYKGSSQTCNTIEAVWKVTTGNDVTTLQSITAGNPYKCLISLQIISGVVQTYISSDGSTNNIASGVRSSLTVSANTTYWFKYTFNGSVYKIDVSTDGNTYINYINISNTNKIPFDGFLGLGKDTGSKASVSEADVHFYGSIDLSQCYIKINGAMWWKGVDYKLFKIRDYMQTGIYYCIGKTNCPMKLSNNINISLSNGTATLKKGSKVYIPAGFYNNTGFWPNMPVHNGVASFYNDNFEWGVINKQYTIGTNDFEIVGKIKLRSAPTKEYADIYAKAHILALSVKNDLSIHCNYGNGVDTWGNDITSSANLLQLNKTYWIKSERKNGVISLSYSQDGINYTVVGTRNSTQSIPSGDLIWIGKDMERTNIFLPGDVFLDGCYIKIGGEYWWKGSDGYGAKFEEYVLPEDNSMGTVGSVTNNGDILYLDWNKNLQPYGHSFVYSSVKAPTSTYAFWYDLSHNIIRYTSDAGSTWYSGHSFPLCLMNITNGTVTAITQLFNGFGYIGSVMFALPNTNGLIANGFKPDKTYNTISYTENSVRVNDYGPEGYTGDVTYAIGPGYFGNTGVGYEVSSDGYLIDKYNNSKIFAYAYATGSRTSGKINNLSLKAINPAATLKPIGFIYQNGKLLYKGRHYEAWSVPSGALSKGYSATGEASGSIGNLFDKNHDTRWGQGVEGNRKWFSLTLPYPVIVDAITVIQGFAGSHDDSRIYNVTFYAELTGANSTGGQIQISNKQSLNWDVKSSTAITITNKPICKRIYCRTEGQAYSTLGEVYISGRRVL